MVFDGELRFQQMAARNVFRQFVCRLMARVLRSPFACRMLVRGLGMLPGLANPFVRALNRPAIKMPQDSRPGLRYDAPFGG